MIRLKEEEFFIEPVKNFTRIQGTSHHPHVVYKRSALPDQGRETHASHRLNRRDATEDADDEFCGVVDKGWWRAARMVKLTTGQG